jgi:oligopeptide/dipeptide ABC transporter ATP-binding protein
VNALLTVEKLSVSFRVGGRTARAVRDATFEVQTGRIVGLVGESGSGKSATALSLLGLHDRDHTVVSGRATLDELELLDLNERALRSVRGARVAMVFQEPMTALNPLVKIGMQIEEVLRAHTEISRKDAHRRAVEIMTEVGIPNAAVRASSYPHQLSGGLRQRAMIGTAIACRPQLLLADEPTTALDVTIQAQILRLLRQLVESHDMSVLLVTHDLGVVAEVCDDVVVMYAGEVVEAGPAADVLADPRHPYTQRLLDARPDLDGWGRRLTAIPGRVPPADSDIVGCAFMPRCEYAGLGCEGDQQLVGVPDCAERSVRCWRASERMQESPR